MNLEGTQQMTDEIEALRLIIQTKYKCSITYDEALEVGESLVSYFKILTDEEADEAEEL